MFTPAGAAAGTDKLPGWPRPCPDWLCWTAGSASSTPAAGPSHLCPPDGLPPTRSPGRKRSRSSPAPSWKQRRGVTNAEASATSAEGRRSLEWCLCHGFGCHGNVVSKLFPWRQKVDRDARMKLELNHGLLGQKKWCCHLPRRLLCRLSASDNETPPHFLSTTVECFSLLTENLFLTPFLLTFVAPWTPVIL